MTGRHAPGTIGVWVSGLLALAAAACGDAQTAHGEDRRAAITLAAEDVAPVESGSLQRGPLVSGNLTPDVQATVRAEAGGSVLSTRAEPGEPVRKGQVLATIDAAALRDQVTSARSAVSSARTARDLAQRAVDRQARLVEAGAVAEQELENARRSLTAAAAQLADAEARLASAREQVGNTIVRAPISGVVSERPVNAGDVVQPGSPLFTVVDPSSMRFEGSIPATEMGDVHLDAAVQFEVTGYPEQAFTGKVSRINPTADPETGQVRLTVSAPNDGQRLVGGLFVRGRVLVEQQHGLIVPAAAVTGEAARRRVTLVRDGVVQHRDVTAVLEDPLTERVLLSAGVGAGDIVLLGAARNLPDGTEVVVPRPQDSGTAPDPPPGTPPSSQ
ncbi:MAG: efflux RND transporter periplasmic adaptor subunit [Vicinamibacterales bacterium]